MTAGEEGARQAQILAQGDCLMNLHILNAREPRQAWLMDFNHILMHTTQGAVSLAKLCCLGTQRPLMARPFPLAGCIHAVCGTPVRTACVCMCGCGGRPARLLLTLLHALLQLRHGETNAGSPGLPLLGAGQVATKQRRAVSKRGARLSLRPPPGTRVAITSPRLTPY